MTGSQPGHKRPREAACKKMRDGGVYLVVADGTEEFALAARYAARLAERQGGHVGILRAIGTGDIQQWGKVEDIMRREARAAAENFVWDAARAVQDATGHIPALYIREGMMEDVLVETIDGDDTIRMLILGGGGASGGPGPLVKHFTGKGIGRLRVPLVILPGHLDAARIDALT